RLIGQEPPLPMMTAQTSGLKDPHEFWAAIGNKMRASIVVTATIAIELFPPTTAPEVSVSQIHFGSRAASAAEGLAASAGPPRFRIGGRVTDAGAAVANVNVTLVELGLVAKSDDRGRYQLGAMASGTYTVRAEHGTSAKTITVAVPPTATTDYDIQF